MQQNLFTLMTDSSSPVDLTSSSKFVKSDHGFSLKYLSMMSSFLSPPLPTTCCWVMSSMKQRPELDMKDMTLREKMKSAAILFLRNLSHAR